MTELGTVAAGTANQKVGMTLADIAYSQPQNIAAQLAQAEYATKNEWSLEWTGFSAGNQMYVARHKASKQWVVAIRGSATNPLTEKFWIDWFEQDLTVFHQVAAPWSNVPSDALIAWGTREGLYDLLAIVGITPSGVRSTLEGFLTQAVDFRNKLPMLVVGHSLGGALASVLAPYLIEEVAKPNGGSDGSVLALTFAAPTAGNAQYAKYLEGLMSGYRFRFENSLDIVPHSWSLSGLAWVLQSYQPAPLMSDFLWGLAWTTREGLKLGSYNFTQPGAGVVTPGVLQKEYWWFEEAGHQHSGTTYLKLYGAPPVVFPPPKTQEYLRLPDRPEIPLTD